MKITKDQALKLLGIENTSTLEEDEINRAFRKASLKCHPDKTLHLSETQQKEACKYTDQLSYVLLTKITDIESNKNV